MKRSIPGVAEAVGRKVAYVESASAETFQQLVDAILKARNNTPLPESGGIIEEHVRLQLRDGTSMLGLSYKGDIDGWRTKLVAFCEDAGRKYGFVIDAQLFLSTGETSFLSDLEVTFL